MEIKAGDLQIPAGGVGWSRGKRNRHGLPGRSSGSVSK